MAGDYTRVDRYSAIALNLIAGHRAIAGNFNAPENIGAFMNDLADDYRLTVRDATTGQPLPGAVVQVFRATPLEATPAHPGTYEKHYDALPDVAFVADATGAGLIGHCPFAADPACTLVLSPKHGANTTLLIRVAHAGRVGYGFLDIIPFNLEYWRGHTQLGEIALDVALKDSCALQAVGCSDGVRDGFIGYSDIASCAGDWAGAQSLRAARHGTSCGNDLGVTCPTPADLCADGWHICGSNGSPIGLLDDLRLRATGDQCFTDAGPGQFVAAFSHTSYNIGDTGCPTEPPAGRCWDAGYGARPVCCGPGCAMGDCDNAVWPGQTLVGGGVEEGCAQLSSSIVTGVMCCRDP